MSELEQVIEAPEAEQPLADARREAATRQAGNPYRSGHAMAKPYAPGELAEKRSREHEARVAELEQQKRATEEKLAQLRAGRPGTSSQSSAAQFSSPAQLATEAGTPHVEPDHGQPASAEETAEEGQEQPTEQQHTQEPQKPPTGHDSRYEVLMERAAKSADPEAVIKSMTAPIFPETPDGMGRYLHLGNCLRSVPNSDDVLFSIGQDPQLLAHLQNATPQEMAAAVLTVSGRLRYPDKFPQAGPVARPVSQAPEPIKPVGGTSGPVLDDVEGLSMAQYRLARETKRIR